MDRSAGKNSFGTGPRSCLENNPPVSASTTLYGGAGSRQTVVAVRHFRRRELSGCSRSKAELVSKIGIVVAEADEAVFWLECLVESENCERRAVKGLLVEANDLGAIFKASHRTARP
jgi:hypothetical protein